MTPREILQGTWTERLRTVRALGKSGDQSAVPVLCEVLQSEDESLRRAAIEALGNLGDRAAVRALVEPLRDPALRLAAVGALIQLGGPEAVALLEHTLVDRDPTLRAAAVSALAALEATEALPAIATRLHDLDPTVQGSAIAALGRLGGPDVVELLAHLLDSQERDVRHAAVEALEAVAQRQPCSALREVLPALRRRAPRWGAPPDAPLYRRAIATIEAATESLKDIPLTATPTPAENLPRPSDSPSIGGRRLSGGGWEGC